MKTALLNLILLALSTTSAHATQYQIYVTHSTHLSSKQTELGSLVQKNIFVDTTAKTIELQLSPSCGTQFRCPMFIRAATLPLTNVQAQNGRLTSATAEGTLSLNGQATPTHVQISLNTDNAMNITITDGTNSTLDQSDFLGSPASSL